MLTGNVERLTPLVAQLRECPMGRRWAWPDDTTPDVVTADRITRWLGASAGVMINRAQRWLEPYAQWFESWQWFSHTARAARARAAARTV